MHPVAVTQQTLSLHFLILQNLLTHLTFVSKFGQRLECYLLTLHFTISRYAEDKYRVKTVCKLRNKHFSSKLSLWTLTVLLRCHSMMNFPCYTQDAKVPGVSIILPMALHWHLANPMPVFCLL